MRWHALHQKNVSANGASCADDGFATEHSRVGIDRHVVFDRGVTLSAFLYFTVLVFLEAARTQRDGVVQFDARPDFAGFADNHTGAMIDKEMWTDFCAGMNVYSSATVRPFRHYARDKGQVLQIEHMRHTLNTNGFQGR